MKTTDYRIATISEGSDFRAISIYTVPHTSPEEAYVALQEHLGHPDVHYVVDTTGGQMPDFESEVQFIADALSRGDLSAFDKVVEKSNEAMDLFEGDEEECGCNCIYCEITNLIEEAITQAEETEETVSLSAKETAETQATREDVIKQIFNIASNNQKFGLKFFPYIDSLCAKEQDNSLDYILHSKYYHTIVATALNMLDNQSQSAHEEATFV